MRKQGKIGGVKDRNKERKNEGRNRSTCVVLVLELLAQRIQKSFHHVFPGSNTIPGIDGRPE
jgi:hypothetical protein